MPDVYWLWHSYSFILRYVKLRRHYGRSEIILRNFTTKSPPPAGVLWLAARALGPAAGVEVGSPAGNELSGRRTESLGNWDSCKVPDSRGNWVSCSSVWLVSWMRSSSFLFIVSSVDAACFTTSESSFKRRSFVRCKAFLEAKTKRLAVYVAVLERYCTAMRLKRKNTNLKLNHNINIITARACFCWRVSVLSLTQLMRGFKELTAIVLNRGRISSVDRALECRAGGGRFDSRGWTNAPGLKITEK